MPDNTTIVQDVSAFTDDNNPHTSTGPYVPARGKLKNPTRQHPMRTQWIEDETRMRASYLATNRALSMFLVPHRFEGAEQTPQNLRRARLGYGISLNRSYLHEMLGHIRGTATAYEWGPLDPTTSAGEADNDGAPGGGLARTLYTDATRTGVPLRSFMEGEVLEWLCSSCGGFVVIDAPAEQAQTLADEQALGKRPYFRFVPFSAVLDVGVDMLGGFRFVKFKELVDERDPDGDGTERKEHFLLYELDPETGVSSASRYDKDGKAIEDENGRSAVTFGVLKSCHGEAVLPLVPVVFGKHPEIPFLGTGLLYGLDDIVIDLFNTVSEMRESYRQTTFGILVHKGTDADKIRDSLSDGSYLVSLGDSPDASLTRLVADSNEVTTGIALIELAVKNWALSAKRQAAEAMGTNAGARGNTSGVALAAEFQLDLRPLLVTLCKTIDRIETECLFLAAQLAGETVPKADELSVKRATEFRLEDEASRIARIVAEYVSASLDLTPEMKVQLAKAWLKASNIIDTTEPVDEPLDAEDDKDNPTGDAYDADAVVGSIGPKAPAPAATVGERIEQELRELSSAQHAGDVAKASAPALQPDPTFAGGDSVDNGLQEPGSGALGAKQTDPIVAEGKANAQATGGAVAGHIQPAAPALPANHPSAPATVAHADAQSATLEKIMQAIEALSAKVDAIESAEPAAAPSGPVIINVPAGMGAATITKQGDGSYAIAPAVPTPKAS